jgi:PAS domain S-box-containing protein
MQIELARLRRELAEARQTIDALVGGEVDAVVGPDAQTPVLLATAQRELREREAWLRAIFERSRDAILVADDDGRYVNANPAACELFGVPLEELCKLTVADVAAPGFDYEAAWKQYLEQGDMAGEFVLVRPDGQERVVDFSARAHIRPGQHLSILRDVTERRRTEEALRETSQLVEQIVASAPVAITVVDSRGGVRLWNRAAESIFGYEAAQVLGDFSPLHRDRREQFLEELTAGAVVHEKELRLTRADGESVVVARSSAPLLDGQGNNRGAVNIWTDVTERAEMEVQLRQSQKMEAVGRLAGGVSHDFNNMLSAILGFAHLIRDELSANDPIYDDINQIIRATERAGELTQRLLAFSRQQISNPVVVDLNELISEFEKMIKRIIGDDIELELALRSEAPKVEIDPGQMEQVLLNLVVNARDAMPEGGHLAIGTRQAGEGIVVTVSDSGVGMEEAVRERVFEPFFTTKEKGEGTGLGLSTVYGILKQYGGDIDVRSSIGRGTTFEIQLPAAEEEEETGEFSRPTSSTKKRVGTETILVVEDDSLVRGLTRQILDRHHYEVLAAANAGEALLIAEQHDGTIDLMVTDVVMPRMSGPQLKERMHELRPDMKVLFMSGYTENKLESLRRSGETVNLLPKPFQPHELLDSVRATLDG